MPSLIPAFSISNIKSTADAIPGYRRVPALIRICFLVDVGLCAAYLLNIAAGEPYGIITSLLDLNGEASLCAWYSSVKFFGVFMLSAAHASHERQKSDNRLGVVSLMVLPAIFLLMSMDEIVQIHEWLGYRLDLLLPDDTREGTVFQKTGIWMFVIGIPFAVLFFGWMAIARKHILSNRSALKKMILGMVLLLTGALGFETVANFLPKSILFGEVLFEEGLEMVGATVIFWSTYELAQENEAALAKN